jgi:hypothetical protein
VLECMVRIYVLTMQLISSRSYQANHARHRDLMRDEAALLTPAVVNCPAICHQYSRQARHWFSSSSSSLAHYRPVVFRHPRLLFPRFPAAMEQVLTQGRGLGKKKWEEPTGCSFRNQPSRAHDLYKSFDILVLYFAS